MSTEIMYDVDIYDLRRFLLILPGGYKPAIKQHNENYITALYSYSYNYNNYFVLYDHDLWFYIYGYVVNRQYINNYTTHLKNNNLINK